jgi:hypothetical protein
MIITDYAEYEALSDEEKAAARPLFSPSDTITPEGVAQYAGDWLEAVDLNENQAVFSMLGMEGIIQPRLSDDNGRGRLINTGHLDSTATLAAYAINYLPNRQKIRPPDLDDTQWNLALHLLNLAVGGGMVRGGDFINIPLSNGIDLDTVTGQGELEAEIEGRESAFDKIQLSASEDQYQSILNYVRTIKDGSKEEVNSKVFASWREEADEQFTKVVEYLTIGETVRDYMNMVDLGNMDSAARTDMISALSDGIEALLLSGEAAEEALMILDGLLVAARSVSSGSAVASGSPLNNVVVPSTLHWRQQEHRFRQVLGTLTQYLINGIGSPEATISTFESMRSEVSSMADSAQTQAERAGQAYFSIGESIVWLIEEQPVDLRESVVRPGWL